MTINERIRRRREELGMTQDELAKKCGYKSRTSINKIEIGGRPLMQDKVLIFARALSMSPAELLGWGNEDIALPSDTHSIPVLGYVAAGRNIYADENVIGTIQVDSGISGDLFALRIKGDSMFPRICDGDTVIVKSQSDAETGQIVIALINGDEGVCKKIVKFNGGITLLSLNQAYEPLTFTDDEISRIPVRILGRVIQCRAEF